jgi:ribulose bisphosphate carboxylase small subunit
MKKLNPIKKIACAGLVSLAGLVPAFSAGCVEPVHYGEISPSEIKEKKILYEEKIDILVNSEHQEVKPTLLIGAPPIRSYDHLEGIVEFNAPEGYKIDPADYRILVYIKVDQSWWIKPYEDSPLTKIASDGSWNTDITTGGHDADATKVFVALVTKNFLSNISSEYARMINIDNLQIKFIASKIINRGDYATREDRQEQCEYDTQKIRKSLEEIWKKNCFGRSLDYDLNAPIVIPEGKQ